MDVQFAESPFKKEYESGSDLQLHVYHVYLGKTVIFPVYINCF
jgi:hypothetical protein